MNKTCQHSSQKVILVTGANRGIGREVCKQLAQNKNVHVIVTARSNLEKTMQDFHKMEINNISSYPLDITSDGSVENLVKWIKENFKSGIDVLINNAGVYSTPDDEKIAKWILETNYVGTKRVTFAFLPLMKDNGRIINVSSSLGLLGDKYSESLKKEILDPTLTISQLDQIMNKFLSAMKTGKLKKEGWLASKEISYGCSKVLLNAFTRILARDLEKKGCNLMVNCCTPGWLVVFHGC